MRKFAKIAIGLVCCIITALAIGVAILNSKIKANVDSETIIHTSRYQDGKFHNTQTFEQPGWLKTLAIAKRYFTEPSQDKVPQQTIPVQSISRTELDALTDNDLHFVKLGHSSVLLKVFGEYWLLDPVFSERASPFSFFGPKRFHPAPITIDDLPNIDKILISHNHYDHLDKAAIKKLAGKTKEFFVPIGVETDLQNWGVPADAITHFSWWQEIQTDSALIAFTPSQHFSGRGISDRNTTLWGSWAIKTPAGSLYFSGDSGYFGGFKEIGEKYGPFDIALIETGAYDKDWSDIHMTPEQSVQAHLDVEGKIMVPVHNGTFDLAFHSWYDPLQRVSAAAQRSHALLLTPIFGQKISFSELNRHLDENTKWWCSLMPERLASECEST